MPSVLGLDFIEGHAGDRRNILSSRPESKRFHQGRQSELPLVQRQYSAADLLDAHHIVPVGVQVVEDLCQRPSALASPLSK